MCLPSAAPAVRICRARPRQYGAHIPVRRCRSRRAHVPPAPHARYAIGRPRRCPGPGLGVGGGVQPSMSGEEEGFGTATT